MVTSEDSSLTAYVLLLAMGLHGFFAGLALGITKELGGTINLFLAIIAHKWSEALTVGISFVSAQIDSKSAFNYILFFSFITPLGILAGYYLTFLNDTVEGIAMAFSAGTFLYISCGEIIVEEFALAKDKYLKFFFYLLGIGFIIFVTKLESWLHA